MMKNEFKKFSNWTLEILSKDELIEYIRLLQENLQTLAIQTERVVEVNKKAFEYVSDEKRKEILEELSKKWEEEEKDEIR